MRQMHVVRKMISNKEHAFTSYFTTLKDSPHETP